VKFVNFGSVNYDYVYFVDHIVLPGETISSTDLSFYCGGKGLNQSIAMSLAGAEVFHAGLIGEDGELLLETCRKHGVNTQYIRKTSVRCGNAIIQVSKSGQNSIVLFGGANRQNTREFVDEVLSDFEEGDYILLQNEMNLLDYIIEKAYDRKMHIVLNPSPYNESIDKCDLGKVSIPADILSMPRKLKKQEFDLIMTHSQNGFEILKDVDFDWPIAEILYQHHERLDGSGYPRGLKGDEICIDARIICVADVVEAMSSHRPYRPALGIEPALSEISQGRGTRYDSQVVDACIRIFRDQNYQFVSA